jgi:hypothetical protein
MEAFGDEPLILGVDPIRQGMTLPLPALRALKELG